MDWKVCQCLSYQTRTAVAGKLKKQTYATLQAEPMGPVEHKFISKLHSTSA